MGGELVAQPRFLGSQSLIELSNPLRHPSPHRRFGLQLLEGKTCRTSRALEFGDLGLQLLDPAVGGRGEL